MVDETEAYLIGLICGRGHIFRSDKKIVIEFAHKNKEINGILACPRCNFIVTHADKYDVKNIQCTNCGGMVDTNRRVKYNQMESTKESLNSIIIPFLKQTIKAEYKIIGNDSTTLLVIDFSLYNKQFMSITSNFNEKQSFDEFHVPESIFNSTREAKIEFMNGIIDTTGFFNSGSWLPRKGKKGYGWMRGYLQVVRNWYLTVELMDLLKDTFNLDVQTIDWGHPNIRDSGLEDYYRSNKTAWNREHQIKFFPEYYSIFSPRIKHKREMFKELITHNLTSQFSKKEVYGVTPVNKIKAFHPEESSKRLPEVVRKHYNASWQIAHDLKSKIIMEKFQSAKNKKVLYLTGKDQDGDPAEIEKEQNKESEKLREKIDLKLSKTKMTKKSTQSKHSAPEKALYPLITTWFEKFLTNRYIDGVEVYDTSTSHLDDFIDREGLIGHYELYEDYKIKPDIVGFLKTINKIAIAEVKIGELTLKDIGQLLGYCLIADPEFAILISPKPPSITTLKVLETNKQILNYSSRKSIVIGAWNGQDVTLY